MGKGDQTKINLFYLDIEDAPCLFVKFDDIWLWYNSLCHVKCYGYVMLWPKLNNLDNIMCKQYQLGKMKKSSFNSKTHTSKGMLEIVHTNLCGPIEVQS